MNRDNRILNRLLKAAAQSPCETLVSIPFALETRILAGCRSARPEGDWSGMVSCFRLAVVCAVLVMVASIGWSQFTNTREVPGAIALSNLVQAVQIVP